MRAAKLQVDADPHLHDLSPEVETTLTVIVGERVRQYRLAAGLSQEALCVSLGLSRPSLANAERGRHVLSLAHLLRASFALTVELHELLPDRAALGLPPLVSLHELSPRDLAVARELLGGRRGC
jgi:transcriptional regulator with XRE-family HTH domain